MALLCNKEALVNRLRSTFLVDQLVEHDLVGDDNRLSSPPSFDKPDSTTTQTDESNTRAQIAKFFLRPESSPGRSVSSSMSSHKSPPLSPLTRQRDLISDRTRSTHSETDTDDEYNDVDFSHLQLNLPDSVSITSPLYDLALEDDSDLEENMVLAAEQLKHTINANGGTGAGAQESVLVGGTDGAVGIRKSISSNAGLTAVRRPSKQRSVVGVHVDVGSVLSGSVLPVRRHSDFPLGSGIDEMSPPQPAPAVAPKEIEVSRVAIAETAAIPPSMLSQQLQQLNGGIQSSLRHYKAAAASADGCQLTFYLPKSPKPIAAKVRSDCPVYMALGYSLYLYVESGQEPKLTEEEYDANSWNVRLAEDDGLPDEDFPALDRVRPITSYSVDEFALVRATEEEFAANSARTPNKFAPRPKQPARMSNPDAAASESQIRVYMYPYDPLLSEPIWDNLVDGGSSVQTIFDSVCKDRMLEQNMYVLRLGATKRIVSNSELVGTLDDFSLEMTPRRALQREDSLPFAISPVKAAAANKRDSQKSTDGTGSLLPANLLGYHQYKVWRRQQMKILGRQRRELAIDGEYIRIQPPEDRMAGENEKTTQFHIKRVGRVKQSSKVSTNFKILVYKDGGPKYYFLEGESPEITRDIVNRISSMMRRSGTSLPRF